MVVEIMFESEIFFFLSLRCINLWNIKNRNMQKKIFLEMDDGGVKWKKGYLNNV